MSRLVRRVDRRVVGRKIDFPVPDFLGIKQARQFPAAANAGLAAGIAQALVDGGFRGSKLGGDGLDGVAGRQQAQDFPFAIGKTGKHLC